MKYEILNYNCKPDSEVNAEHSRNLSPVSCSLTIAHRKILRQRLGYEEEDTAPDELIDSMSPERVVKELTAWELGYSSWADKIAFWMVIYKADPNKF